MAWSAFGAAHGMTRARGTLFGLIGVLGWAIYALFVALANGTPRYLFVAILFTVAMLTLLALRIVQGGGLLELVRIPISTLALGVLGLAGANLLQVQAFGSGASPYAVAVLTFAWPVLMVALMVVFRIAVPGVLDWIGLGCGLAGVASVTMENGTLSYHYGLLLAFLGALCWATYSAFRNWVPAGPRDSMVAFAAVSALLGWTAHVLSGEPTAVPSGELVYIVLLGVIPVGLSNLLWDIGARYGDPVTLAGLSYLEPILSMGLLIAFLDRPFTRYDLVGLVLVVLGGLAIMIGDRRRRHAEQALAPGTAV